MAGYFTRKLLAVSVLFSVVLAGQSQENWPGFRGGDLAGVGEALRELAQPERQVGHQVVKGFGHGASVPVGVWGTSGGAAGRRATA